MSEPKDSDAQNLDLGALDDALGGLEDGVSKPNQSSPSGKKADEKTKDQDAYDIDDSETTKATETSAAKPQQPAQGTDSPNTLSPSSLRSASPPPSEPSNAATTPSHQTQSKPQSQQPTAAKPTSVDSDTAGKIRAIRGMFPSLDDETVGAVLAAEGGDEENAINVLLSMSDPSSTPQPPSSNTAGAMSDEALARSLALEEDEAYARAQARQEQQRYQARQQSQPGGRGGRGGTGGAGGMFQDFFGGLGSSNDTSSQGGQGATAGSGPGGRGGGGAASFFNDLKQSVQPLFDGKGPLARGSQTSDSLNSWGEARSVDAAQPRGGPPLGSPSGSYDPSQLTYQPRVRKTPAQRSAANPTPQQPPSTFQRPSQQTNSSAPSSAWSQGGRYNTPAQPATSSRHAQWGGSNSPQQSRNLGKAAVVGTGAGAGAGSGPAASSFAASSSSSSSPSVPPSVASVLQEGGHKGETSSDSGNRLNLRHRDEEDADDDDDDVNSDDLEFQKSPFDDED